MTIKEAAVRLGIAEVPQIGDMGQASAVLKYFGVEPTIENIGGKPTKVYDEALVDKVRALKA